MIVMVLYLWHHDYHGPMPAEALRVIEAWGFRLHNFKGFTWAKVYPKQKEKFAIGMGHMTRANSEDMLFAVKGRMLKRLDASICQMQLHIYPRMEHSAKPPEFRDLLVKLVGDVPRIELFARSATEGWHTWGNECPCDVDLLPALAVEPIKGKEHAA